jgi:hypothetical protein
MPLLPASGLIFLINKRPGRFVQTGQGALRWSGVVSGFANATNMSGYGY